MNSGNKQLKTRNGAIDCNLDECLAEYGASVRKERLSEEARANIAASLHEYQAGNKASSNGASLSANDAASTSRVAWAHRYRRPVKWAIAAASITVLALVGAAAIAANPSLPGNSGDENALVETSTVQNDAGQQGNFFALKAWADEAPEGASVPAAGDPVGINWLHPGFVSSWESWAGTEPYESLLKPGQALTYFNFDTTCEGNNLASVTYRINNPDAFFEFFDWKEVDALRDAGADVEEAMERGSSFTITYGEEGNAETAYARLYVISPYNKAYDSNPHAVEPYVEAAKALDGSLITLTATFVDGTEQTMTYQVAMSADFEAKCADFLSEYFAAWDVAGPQGKEAILDETFGAPKLFTLELLEN